MCIRDSPYSASKFALTGLSNGLRVELAKEGVYVTTVCPGLMRTGSHVHALFKGKRREELAWFAFFEFLFFIGILVVAYVYVWRKGALEWQ